MKNTYFKLPISFTPNWQAPVISAKGLYTLRVKHITYIALAALAACAIRLGMTLYQNWMTRIEVRELFANIKDGADPKLPDDQIVKAAQKIQDLAHAGLPKTAPNTLETILKAAQNRINVRKLFTSITSITEVSPQTDKDILQQAQDIEHLGNAGLTPEEQTQITQLKSHAQLRTEVRTLFQEMEAAHNTPPFLKSTDQEILRKAKRISDLLAGNLVIERVTNGSVAELSQAIAQQAKKRLEDIETVYRIFTKITSITEVSCEADQAICKQVERIKTLAHAGLQTTQITQINEIAKQAKTRLENAKTVRTLFTNITSITEFSPEADQVICKQVKRIKSLGLIGLHTDEQQRLTALAQEAQERTESRRTVKDLFIQIQAQGPADHFSTISNETIINLAQDIENLGNAGLTPEEQAQINAIVQKARESIEVRTLFKQVVTIPISSATLDQIQGNLKRVRALENLGLSTEECVTLDDLNSTLTLLRTLKLNLHHALVPLPLSAMPMQQMGALAKAFHNYIPTLKTTKKGAIAFLGFQMLVDKMKEEFVDKPQHQGRFAKQYLPMLKRAFQAISIAFLGKGLMTPNPQEALAFFKACQSSDLLEDVADLFKISVQERIKDLAASFETLPELSHKTDILKQMQDLECLAADGLLPDDYQTQLADMQEVCTDLENAAKEKRCIDLIVGPSQEEGAAEARNPEELLLAIAELKRELRYENKLIEGVSPSVVAALDLLEKLTHMNRQRRFTIDDFLSLPNQIVLNFFEDQLEGRPIAPYMQALAAPLTECATAAYTKTAAPNEWKCDMVDQLSTFYEWADLLPTKGLPSLSLILEFGTLEDTIQTFNLSLNDDQPVILPSMVYRLCAMVKQHKKTSINPLPAETLQLLITRLREAQDRYPPSQNPEEIMRAVNKLERIINL